MNGFIKPEATDGRSPSVAVSESVGKASGFNLGVSPRGETPGETPGELAAPNAFGAALPSPAFSLRTARACVAASRLAYESPTITTRRCHVTVLETAAVAEASRLSPESGEPPLPVADARQRVAATERGSAIRSKPERAEDAEDSSTASRSGPLRVIDPRSVNALHALDAPHPPRPCLVVAFRGTANLVDFLTDAQCWRISVPRPASRISNRASPTVHSGFWLSLLEILQPLGDYISGLAPRPLIVTGHSLGGALALLFTYRWNFGPSSFGPSDGSTRSPSRAGSRDFRFRTSSYPIVATYTFGQPRCGNRDFAAGYDAIHRASTFRCVNEEDLVPRIPGVLAGYRHAGQEIFFPTDSETTTDKGKDKNSSSPSVVISESVGYWIDPPLWRKLLSDARGLYRSGRRKPAAALGQLLLDHHISNYVERLGR